MSGDVRGLFGALGVRLPERGGPNVPVRCFASAEAHRRGDRDASASVNLETGAWFCHACGARGGAYDAALALGRAPAEAMELLQRYGLVVGRERPQEARGGAAGRAGSSEPPRARLAVTEEDGRRWQMALLGNELLLDRLADLRGWTQEAIERLGLGLDGKRVVFPWRDAEGRLVGVGRYQPNSARRNGAKMRADVGSRRELFPAVETVDEGDGFLFLVEGEPDAVAAHSAGLPAVAVPGVEGWRPEYAERLRGRCVVIVFDCDEPGRAAARRIAQDLVSVAAEVRIVDLAPERDDGYDLTDLLLEKRRELADSHEFALENEWDRLRAALLELAENAPRVEPRKPEPARESDKAQRAYLLPASGVRRERVAWLVEGRIPLGALTILLGAEGYGKTLYTCHLAAGVSTGELGGVPAAVLMATAEDSLGAVMRPRLEAAGADLERVSFVRIRYPGGGEGDVTIPEDVAELERLVADTRARLVTVDPVVAHLSPAVNSWKDQDVRLALAPLHHVAERHGCAILVVLHPNKRSETDPLARAGGSRAFTAAARSVLLFAHDPDDPEGENGRRRVLAHVKTNLGLRAPSLSLEIEPVALPAVGDEPEVATARIVERGESSYTGRELFAASGTSDAERNDLADAEDFLREELALGARPTGEILAAARGNDVSERTLKRAKKRLGVRSEKVGQPGKRGHWEWSLPDPEEAPAEEGQGGWPPSQDADVGPLRANGSTMRDYAPSEGAVSPEGGQYQNVGPLRERRGLLGAPLPGDEGFLTFVRDAYRAGFLTRDEWLERVGVHGLIWRARPPAAEGALLDEVRELVAAGVLAPVAEDRGGALSDDELFWLSTAGMDKLRAHYGDVDEGTA